MSDSYKKGQRILDQNGKQGRIKERVTIGRIYPSQATYAHVYDVVYDDGTERRRMHYHLTPAS